MKNYSSNFKPQKKDTGNIIKLLLVVVGFVAVTIFVYTNFIKIETTIVSGVNLLDKKIFVEVGNNIKEVEPEDMFYLRTHGRGDVIVSIKDEEQEIIRENKYLLNNSPGIIFEVVSSVDQDLCLVSADVSNIYYIVEEIESLSDINIVANEAFNSYYYNFPEDKQDVELWVYPGYYDSASLPEILKPEKRVFGLFLIDCAITNSEENISNQIMEQFQL